MPGIPCVYYGSEWGTEGRKEEGDPSLRLSYDEPQWNELTDWISKLAKIKKEHKALQYGSFTSTVLPNGQCIFKREWENECIYIAINAADQDFWAGFHAGVAQAVDLISGETVELNGGVNIPSYSAMILRAGNDW